MKKLIMLTLTAVLAASLLVSCSSDSSTEAGNTKPICNITSPTANKILYPGSTVEVKTEAAASEGQIDSVRYFIDGVYEATDFSSPYNWNWNTTGLSEKDYFIKAISYASNNMQSDPSEISVKLENQAPTCSITEPSTSEKAFIVGSKVMLKVAADDADGEVTSVKFKLNGVVLATDTEAPFEIEWNTVDYDHGSYRFEAVAYDNDGKQGVSEEIFISLNRGSSFEDLVLDENSYWNGSDGNGSFVSGSVSYSNKYNSDYGSWSEIAYSNMTDKTTPGFANQYSVYANNGADGSGNFAICSVFDSETFVNEITPVSVLSNEGVKIKQISVNNTTYGYLSMRDGDDVAKQFGGESGNDPDWFKLTITGISPSGNETGNVEFYLADYRNNDGIPNYIVGQWMTVDLTSLGDNVKQLKFSLSSSDNGDYGMNTPAYFAFDNLIIEND